MNGMQGLVRSTFGLKGAPRNVEGLTPEDYLLDDDAKAVDVPLLSAIRGHDAP